MRRGKVVREYVLRRPPLGPIPPGAHDMRREHRVLSRLHARFPLAPRSLLLCEDESIIGAVFIIEERRRGFVIRDDIPAEFAGRPDLNRRIGDALIDALADLHLVAPAAAGLGDLGRPEGYAERQLAGWSRRWQAAQGGEEAERSAALWHPVLDWLGQHLPNSRGAALLHNDYRLDNCLLDPADPAHIEAVLDWDMCTQGDPLADLGYILNYWVERDDPPEWREIAPRCRPGVWAFRRALRPSPAMPPTPALTLPRSAGTRCLPPSSSPSSFNRSISATSAAKPRISASAIIIGA